MEVVKGGDKPTPAEAPNVTSKVPRILCELFVYGIEADKPKIKDTLEELQRQMDKARRNKHKVRVCYYLDKGEKNLQEKLEWFKENGKCKYFIEIDGTKKISKDFVKDTLVKIRVFENSLKSIKSANIKIFGRSEPPSPISEAEVVE